MFQGLLNVLSVVFIALLISRLSYVGKAAFPSLSTNDDYLWLEGGRQDEQERVSTWVKAENEKTLASLTEQPEFKRFYRQAFQTLTDDSKLPAVNIAGAMVRNVWKDENAMRGIWRQMSYEAFRNGSETWQDLLDIDSLAKKEQKSWVWRGAYCLSPEYRICMVALSDGGKDAVYYREFDTKTREFVAGGFRLSESKSRVTWINADTLLVASALSDEDKTKSGYPKKLYLWQRGQSFQNAALLDEGQPSDVSIGSFSIDTPKGGEVFVYHGTSFFTKDYYRLKGNGELTALKLDQDADIEALLDGRLFISLKKDAYGFLAGDLLSISLEFLDESDSNASESLPFELVFRPSSTQTLESVFTSQNYLWIICLDQVRAKLLRFEPKSDLPPSRWKKTQMSFADHGNIRLMTSSQFHSSFIVTFESFLEPKSMYLVNEDSALPKLLRTSGEKALLPNDYNVEQRFAISKDGTKIPYFIIGQRQLFTSALPHPTILYGYGGFNISQTPNFSAVRSELWIKEKGLFVVASIRGGGEFGPSWHQAALKENRQKAFDDFIAVGEDLVSARLTTPEKLAIMGGSNGGLLVGAVATQRPELFQAVICQVPLLDMLRYHKLYAGASWVGEYGNPDAPEMAKILYSYSPYHQLKQGKTYPEFFLMTSSKDDRVHPAHARKMAAKLNSLGLDYLYFENTEGGHAASADYRQMAQKNALIYTFLWDRLAK